MRCPFCSSLDTKVVDSRLAGEGDQIRRRRECTECAERFTSYEKAELNYPHIAKSDGRREQFMEEKLRALGEHEVKSRRVGDWVMMELRKLDQVAYVRFASVYRSFEDVRAFLEEIERLEHELPPELRKNQLDLLGENDAEKDKP